jgi:hypothetical protein
LKIGVRPLDALVAHIESLAAGDAMVGGAPHAHHVEMPGIPGYDGCGNCLDSPLSYINFNGGVYPCPGMYKSPWALGNVRTASFLDISRESGGAAGVA